MSIRFRIKNIAEKATKEGDAFVRYSGKGEPYDQSSERDVRKVGVDGAGNPRFVFVTGLNEKKVDSYKWYSEEERKEIKKQLKEHMPAIEQFYGGKEILEETNKYFWKDERAVNKFAVTHEIENYEYDTKNPAHALLYFSIIAGAFLEAVAPTEKFIRDNPSLGLLHYLHLETDDNQFDGEAEITRSDAHFALGELKRDGNQDALFILAWCLQYDTTAFGAYTKSTSPRNLVNYHIEYIDGKLGTKGIRKKNFPKLFLEYAEKWKGQQTRPKLYIEAYAKAAEYYSFLNKNSERKYQTLTGVVLGTTIGEVVENLSKPKFQTELENLREQVEAKWKE